MQTIQSKTILNSKKSRDNWFLDDYTLNPYSGCSFNCQFCYIRGSKFGEHMERKTAAKSNAPELLEKQLKLRASKQQYGFIILGSASDAYLHFERETQLTRQLLEIILKYRFPVHVITRSGWVERDFDLLKEIQKTAILPDDLKGKVESGTLLSFSFSSVNQEWNRLFEPGAPPIQDRLNAMRRANEAELLTGACLMPLLPYISDTDEEISKAVHAIKENGGQYTLPAGLTLFGTSQADSKTLTFRVIDQHFPHLKWKYRELFAFGHEVPPKYQQDLQTRALDICKSLDMPTSIFKAEG